MADLVQITDAGFEADVVGNAKPVVLDFWAPWCGPCRMMEPVLHEIAEEFADKIVIGKLNVDENPATAQKFDILSIPTLLVFANGEVVKKLVGAMPKKRLLEELAPWIG
ncbi:MAG: thioredoxin [Actinomycetota bacterium]|nr:thioredoxin [Coriobacteriia bacterium]MDP2232966.1 thioredoxin [Actinomycetota bacterium]